MDSTHESGGVSAVRADTSFSAHLFVGRERDRDLLRALLAEAAAGRGGVALLAGEPGIGKTRTMRELAAEASRDGAIVLWGRCFDGDWPTPYGPWAEVLRGCVRAIGPDRLHVELGPAVELLAGLLTSPRVAPAGPVAESAVPPSSERECLRLYDAVASLLLVAASDRPVLLVLDDLHWADHDSLRLLRYLARGIGEARLLLVGAYRDVELEVNDPLADVLTELGREVECERIVLRGLTESEVARYLAGAAGRAVRPTLVRLIHAETDGNPFYVRELFHHLAEEGRLDATEALSAVASSEDLGAPAGVRHVVGRRVARLSPEAQELVRMTAAFPRGFDLHVVQALTDRSEEELLDRLDEVVRARLVRPVGRGVGRYRFSHTIVRQAVYDKLGAGRRARLHRHIGEVLERLYAADLEPHLADLADHFERALVGGCTTKALEYAVRAAQREIRLLAFDEAVGHFRRALEILDMPGLVPAGDPEQRCELLLALGDVEWKVGEVTTARSTFLEAARIARGIASPRTPHLLARAALGVRGVVAIGPVDAAMVDLLEEALTALGEEDSTLHVRLLARLSQALYVSGERRRRAELGRQAVEMARRLRDKSALVHALVASHFSRRGPEGLEERLASATEIARLAEEVGDQELACFGQSWRFTCLLELGDVAAADSVVGTLGRMAEEFRQPFFRWRAMLMQTVRALMAGALPDAEHLAQEMITLGRQIRDPAADMFYALALFLLLREQGRRVEIEQLEATVRELVDRTPALPIVRCWLALLELELGREEAARRQLGLLARADFADLPRDVSWLPLVCWLAELCSGLGDVSRAAILYTLLEPYAGHLAVLRNALAFLGSASHYLGLLAALLGRRSEAGRHFEEALASHARLDARPLLARTRYQYAALLLADDRPAVRARAFELLDAAHTDAEELGLALLAEQVLALRAADGRPPESPVHKAASDVSPPLKQDPAAPLTRREREVAVLVVRGLSNREIGEALVISERTAEMHVGNILGKLGLTTRAQAAVWAAEHGLLTAASRR